MDHCDYTFYQENIEKHIIRKKKEFGELQTSKSFSLITEILILISKHFDYRRH